MKKEIKNIFVTGLLIFVPISATLFLIFWVFKYIEDFLYPYLAKSGHYIPGMGWLVVVLTIFLFGLLGRFTLGNRILGYAETQVRRIPIIRTIYVGVKEATKAILVSEAERLKGVVLIEYPRKGVYTLGFTTGSVIEDAIEKTGKKLINVFVPTSPNPTSGFVILVPEEEVIYLDVKVEDALKVVISGGFTQQI
ncbi:hypothetical protein Asulf_00476 [Archaeoglobus sulfaticallidus PM70-1]|uniref:DUF502 domain-containing protein n=1 Tax=Archaeoglobus sulfaticallidus PM70-1 TaxID=387631 RepID=N0BC03_9EURY|nr:DUF502 domain-containing protein [Archaeoglobus sulfaticallidus]AGK60503.1 hypothetical protein Asulf_00476 [Archaeoglobus sulfaticallidus PM70-1]